jgi:Tol biopolymer transport system component
MEADTGRTDRVRSSPMIGSRFGSYEVTAQIGEGGMGRVYKAKDSQLGREVALKVLPEGFTQDAERLARFEREAKLLASLNHPNIAQIYGLETSGGSPALVMELVEGPTLADRLAQGRLAVETSLSIARQIAAALEEAHEKGIVHRDLKPQNVKASIEGKVKVLDFGLAKAMEPAPGVRPSSGDLMRSPTLMHSPTLTGAGTQLGVILGTAAYMSPEQARGGDVDERADIWAFGVVLWEMLSGRALFAGPTVSDTLASVLKVDPDLAQLPADTPRKLRRLLERCLRKDPRERLHAIADARLVLEEVERGELDEEPAALAAPRRPVWQVAAALAVAAVAGALAVWAIGRFSAPAEAPPRVVRFDFLPPEKLVQVGAPKVSPDGRNIAFGARDEKGGSQVWLRALDAAEARPLAGSAGVDLRGRPFWSPDSRTVAFFAGGKLLRVPIDGGPAQKVCDAAGADASWSEQGAILFDGSAGAPILGVPASGGVPRVVVANHAGEKDGYEVAWPQFLPGGRRFLYVVFSGGDERNGIWIADADGGHARRVVAGVSRAEFAPPGWLLFVRDSTLVAQRLDPETGELGAEPVPIADGLGVSSVGLAAFSVSRDGVLAYRASDVGADQLAFYDRHGVREAAPLETGRVNQPVLSPDGRWLAFDRDDDGNRDVWLRDLKRGVTSRFTFAKAEEFAPVFSPDGQRIYFARGDSGGKWSIVARPLGTGAEVTLSTDDVPGGPVACTPDGRDLLVARFPDGKGDLALLDLQHPGKLEPYIATPDFAEFRASFSPDGRWLAYQSNESGRPEIYVQPFPGPGRKWQVSTAGGAYPIWSPRGGEIFYRDGSQRLIRVEVRAGAEFDAGVPEPLFQLPLGGEESLRKIAMTPDGERFVVLASAGDRTSSPTSVIVGWNAVLPRQ